MRQKTAYECEFCGNTYIAQDVCEECEAHHFGLSRKEYLDWRILNKDAAYAGKIMGRCCNEYTRSNFDRAIEKLVSFEKRHGIAQDCKKPTDFYFWQ